MKNSNNSKKLKPIEKELLQLVDYLTQVPFDLSISLPLFDRIPFVMQFFTLCQAYLYLGKSPLVEVNFKRDDGKSLVFQLLGNARNFLFFQQ